MAYRHRGVNLYVAEHLAVGNTGALDLTFQSITTEHALLSNKQILTANNTSLLKTIIPQKWRI